MFSFFNALFLYEFLNRQKYKIHLTIVKFLMYATILGILVAWSPQVLESIRKLAFLGSMVLVVLTTTWTVSAMRDKVLYSKSIFAFNRKTCVNLMCSSCGQTKTERKDWSWSLFLYWSLLTLKERDRLFLLIENYSMSKAWPCLPALNWRHGYAEMKIKGRRLVAFTT